MLQPSRTSDVPKPNRPRAQRTSDVPKPNCIRAHRTSDVLKRECARTHRTSDVRKIMRVWIHRTSGEGRDGKILLIIAVAGNVVRDNSPNPMATDDMPAPGATPTPSAEPDTTAWVARDEAQRAKQLQTATAKMVSEDVKLKWTTTADLQQLADDSHTAIMAKQGVAASGGGQTATLRAIDERISKVVPELRGLLKKKFKDDYQAYYEEFGFMRSGKNWELPVDRDLRANKIENLLLPALTRYGMQADVDSGTAVWQTISTDLKAALGTSIGTKQNRATYVAATTPQGEKVETALRCIVHLVRANYPDAPEKMLRAFGFLKESN